MPESEQIARMVWTMRFVPAKRQEVRQQAEEGDRIARLALERYRNEYE